MEEVQKFPLNQAQAVRGQKESERNLTAAEGEAQEMNHGCLYFHAKNNFCVLM